MAIISFGSFNSLFVSFCLLYTKVYRQHIPVSHLVVEDLNENSTESRGSSFKSSFKGHKTAKTSNTSSGESEWWDGMCLDMQISWKANSIYSPISSSQKQP